MLSAAKNLCVASEILRCAQHDSSLLILVVNIHQGDRKGRPYPDA